MSKITLYDLAEQYQRLMDMATDDDFDHSVGLPTEFIEALESLEDQIENKIEGCCRAYKSMVSLKNGIDDEIGLLRLRSGRLENAINELKGYMQYNMEQMEIKKMTAGIFKLSVCLNSQPSVTILDLQSVPAKFDKPVERQVSLTAIRDAVKKGEEVPGVDVVRGSHLRIS